MKASFRRSLFVPSIFVLGLMSLVIFQNCSNDVGFDSDPSATRAVNPVNGQDINTDAPVSGNSDVIIQINEAPGDSTNTDGGVVDFEVTAPNGSITDVKCLVNGVQVACDPKDRIVIPPTGTGPQEVIITGTNSNGNVVTETITWTVYDSIVQKIKDFSVTEAGDKVDIVINVDNSGSMQYEQESMAARIANFMAPFAGLDYHIAITTTSPIGGIVDGVYVWKPELDYVDGKFTMLDGAGTYCIKSSVHSPTRAQELVENNVERSLVLLEDDGITAVITGPNNRQWPEGNGFERGIFTTRRAFERDMANTQNDNSCIRDGSVPKHVILISDEDETIYQEDQDSNPIINAATGAPTPLVDLEKSRGANLRSYISTSYGADTVFKFHSIIVNPFSQEGVACLSSHGRSLGVDYANLSQMTGGYIGSVCAQDYSTQLGEIGKIISDSSLAEALGCVAIANDAGDFGDVIDRSNSQEVGTNYEFIGDKVEFEQYLPRGEYRITYYCYE